MPFKFNPFTGTFDLVNTDVDTSSFARFVPTDLSTTFTIPDNAQALMVRRAVLESGGSIVIGQNSVLVQVA
jgi:hypothetical protein